MIKYWKFTAIIIVIVFSIGTFYVNSSTSAEQSPTFHIKALSGDEKEITPLIMEGYYVDISSMNIGNSSLAISAKGTTYQSHSFLDQIAGNPPTVIKRLQEKNRAFMRGKNYSEDLFFENKQFLAYADVASSSVKSRNYKFDISVLTKKDDTINSFKLDVPEGKEMDHLLVEDVQIIGDKLYLITHNIISKSRKQYEEKHIYTIDLSTKKMIDHEAIIQFSRIQKHTSIDVQLVRTSLTKTSEHLILLETENKVNEDMESTSDEVVIQEISSYNIQTKEKETINIPGLHLGGNRLSFFDDSIIYFMMLDGQNLLVTPYRLADDTVGQPYNIQLSGEKGTVSEPITTVKDGKLYIASSQMNEDINADVIVADAYTGEILFKGQVALDGSSKDNGNFDLSLFDLFVK
ncbi:hypothetical protein M3197_07210 [Sporosarcina aquimarina]|uniref:hypothetical protein n=1 Tax=Sporosarcina aquimarina TaxID=114975 RepID=UPI00203E418B|nr:hypothetical protein [Sporosarcina aquimarina]MCM3757277.1 hypothetical protein [Sporosarcina aquimarina]